MDISEIGIVVSVVSVSIAVLKMNRYGKPNNKNNYVKRDDCHNVRDGIDARIKEARESLHKRIDDVCGKIDIVVKLLIDKK